MRRLNSKTAGFSLIELSLLLIVLGFIMSGFFYYYNYKREQEKMERADYAVFTVTDGLSKFLSRNRRYPCPARLNLPQNDANYGVETDCAVTTQPIGTCQNGICIAENPPGSGRRIRIGAIPNRTLNVGREDVLDAYKNRFTYAVTETQARLNPDGSTAYVRGNGTIRLQDVNAAGIAPLTRNDIDMVFLSHGENGAGSYTADGLVNGVPCNAAGMDRENCDNDGEFISKRNAAVAATGLYDDNLISSLWSWIYIWDVTSADQRSIYNRDVGNMGIGTQLPAAKLHVAAGNMRVNGNAQVRRLCNQAGQFCFDPDKLGGTGMVCDPGKIMTGVANSNAICTSILFNKTGTCQNRSFMTKFTFNATNNAMSVTCKNHITGGQTTVNMTP